LVRVRVERERPASDGVELEGEERDPHRKHDQRLPWSSGIRLVVDHFPKSCGPPEYHLRSIKRLQRRRGSKAESVTPIANTVDACDKGLGFRVRGVGCRV